MVPKWCGVQAKFDEQNDTIAEYIFLAKEFERRTKDTPSKSEYKIKKSLCLKRGGVPVRCVCECVKQKRAKKEEKKKKFSLAKKRKRISFSVSKSFVSAFSGSSVCPDSH